MTSASAVASRRWSLIDDAAPAERLALFRITTAGFTVLYLLLRSPMFLDLANRPADAFNGVGLFALIGRPMPGPLPQILLFLALMAGSAMVVGYRYRLSAPAFAALVFTLASYRSSWGQLLHFEHLFTLHVVVLAFAPAADAISLDAQAGRNSSAGVSTRYGFPLRIACLVVTITYVIAGVAKLRYGGLTWITGDTLLNHIAYSAARLELLGGTPSPLAQFAVSMPGVLLSTMAGISVLIELIAPVALLGARWRTGWVAAAWLLHAGTFALMLVGFPYPLFAAAFAPFFALERGWRGHGPRIPGVSTHFPMNSCEDARP